MLAIIPARGGSKGILGKNIKELCGKPLIAYTIEAALKARKIDRVVVSTDSKEIAEVAMQYGAEIPFMRPSYLAKDDSSAVDVYLHAVEFLEKKDGLHIDKFVVLLPTAPLRDAYEIDCAVQTMEKCACTSLISVVEADAPASWYYQMNENRVIKNAGFDADNAIKNRQMNCQYYVPNGAIYILDYQLLKRKRTYYTDDTIGYVMTKKKSVDIDTEDDFEYAEYLLRKKMYDRRDGVHG
ncbi:MAG: acylneuraminate cytidylyltransferase family protein [Lachnospiraceae bacterium]|jgi:CMP-N-acetylneuraminic acid synthetase|nr:acylneuraminate cytidylyltransferase family protein [Lachnospiraceae bacterium]